MTIPAAFSDDITLVPFAPEHLEGAHRLSQIAQWPHRVEDWALNLSVSKGVIALKDGAVVGTAICSILGEVATFNMIIVDQNLRGRGLGRQLMTELFELAGTRELRLVATEDGLPLYQKLGFEVTGEIVQHQGAVKAAAPEQPVDIVTDNLSVEIADLAAQDASATGMYREKLFNEIITQSPEETVLFKTEGGSALLRRFGRGLVLGPVLASTDKAAKSLIAAAASHVEGQFLRLDMPKEVGLSGFAETLGLPHVARGTVMVAQPAHMTPSTEMKTYTLVSQALG